MGAACCCHTDSGSVQEVKALSVDLKEKDAVCIVDKQAENVSDAPKLDISAIDHADSRGESPARSSSDRKNSDQSLSENASPMSKITVLTVETNKTGAVSTTTSMHVNQCTTESPQQADPDEPTMRLLLASSDPVRQWFHKAISLWRDLPVGDACDGKQFLEVASSISGIYPYVFSLAYAQKFLTKDLVEQTDGARKHWPEGAVTCRDAVRGEIAKIGIPEIEKRYWNTCTCRLLWVTRAMRIQLVILESVVTSDTDPVKCAQNALNTVCGEVLNFTLKKVADYIIWFCVFKKRQKLFEKMGIPELEAHGYIKILLAKIRPHAEFMQGMFDEVVPTVVKKRP